MYKSIQVPWSASPSQAELTYRSAGLVRTQGTIFLLPPEHDALIQAFETPPRPKTRSSSGAVALCKHFERGGASSEHGKAHPFWPLPTGSNDNKTKLAAATMDKMLNDIAWKNVMLLHPGVAVYEIRNSLGYGMRWTLDVEDDTSKIEDLSPSNMVPTTEESGVAGENAEKKRTITKVSFRGFLEPIIGMDDELPRQAGNG
ncbi:hypothetical protein LTR70_005518 [Exophiala xenobiotica]|uniref:Uncharacterized protein n=1 Tax=Lithohypha guttulata TaxID=1690604 RepID=A0ABR0JWT6_9EURO|nr:hypothetical protein LTR24_009808 [Lithohypha guttulata]KAK5318375.1 hypothetical protein LTR70_005518 [Exophiala xenobiotica]